MIWNDAKIREWASSGGITPYDESLVNPASLDLRLGKWIREPLQHWSYMPITPAISKATPACDLWTDAFEFETYILKPGQCVLAASVEYITMPDDAVGLLASKSSTGRLLLEHFHSGFFDCGFTGTGTLELKNDGKWPLELRPGDLWVQLILMQMVAPAEKSYQITGRYNGQILPEAHRAKALVDTGPDSR